MITFFWRESLMDEGLSMILQQSPDETDGPLWKDQQIGNQSIAKSCCTGYSWWSILDYSSRAMSFMDLPECNNKIGVLGDIKSWLRVTVCCLSDWKHAEAIPSTSTNQPLLFFSQIPNNQTTLHVKPPNLWGETKTDLSLENQSRDMNGFCILRGNKYNFNGNISM